MNQKTERILNADLVMFTGTEGVVTIGGKDFPRQLKSGTLGFVNGSRVGTYDVHLTTRKLNLWVRSIDLKPMQAVEMHEDAVKARIERVSSE